MGPSCLLSYPECDAETHAHSQSLEAETWSKAGTVFFPLPDLELNVEVGQFGILRTLLPLEVFYMWIEPASKPIRLHSPKLYPCLKMTFRSSS